MSIRDLIDQFEIQGAYCIKSWDDNDETYIVIAKGEDFEYEHWKINDEHLERNIAYMYAVDGVLNIEIE